MHRWQENADGHDDAQISIICKINGNIETQMARLCRSPSSKIANLKMK